jgi:putative membrane protein
MEDFIITHYLWFKSLHLIAVISWMAGLLYLPRLFVYHAQAEKGSAASETFKVMELRLYRYIMGPASIATWVLGGMMLWANWDGIMAMHWMHAKLTLVFLLTGFHHALGAWRKKFARDENARSAKFYKICNELPTLMMIVIVILVIVKPF